MLPKIQHYVHRFVLRNFCFNEGEQIYVFDKKTERVFSTNIENVAAEKDFYNFNEGDNTFSVEHNLGNLEAATAGIIEKIVKHESLSGITKDEKLLLSIFIAAQFSRTKQQRLLIKQFTDNIVEAIKKMGGNPQKIEGFTPFANEAELDKFAIITLKDNIKSFSPLFYERGWVLYN
jgi:Protein of unknown function (DUF4238)